MDNATECVANATCKNVTSPQCTCDTGFSVMTNSTTNTSYCRAGETLYLVFLVIINIIIEIFIKRKGLFVETMLNLSLIHI